MTKDILNTTSPSTTFTLKGLPSGDMDLLLRMA